MVKIEFVYMKNKYIMENDDNNTIFQKYSSLINKDLNQLLFLYKGKYLNIGQNLDILNFQNIIIFVFNTNQNKNNNNEKIKDIICPECGLLDTFVINDNSFINKKCNNHHNYTLSLNSFISLQKRDEQNINCYRCGNDKLFYNDLIYINTKGKYICPLCLNFDESDIINYKFKYYICIKHNKKYESYCNECKINLCKKCEINHKRHKIILFKKIKPNKKRIEEIKNEKSKLNKYKSELNELKNYIITIYEYIMEEIDNYNKIYDYIIESEHNLNYESINNILNFKTDKLMKEIDDFLNQNNINKIRNIIIKYENKINELSIIYNKGKNGIIKLFDSEFVKNNKGKCYLLINNKITELVEKIDYHNYFNNNNERKIKIRIIENKSYSFFSGYSNGITNMSYMFYRCTSISSLPDISKWNTNNVTNMNYMFYRCLSLSSLPDISKWNTSNVTNMSYMFYGCSSLLSLPDISKWNTSNVTNMSDIFNGCSSLSSLPDISKWNTSNVINMIGIFNGCSTLSSLPDISKWNTNNVTNMNYMFYRCSSLLFLPDISKWNTSNVINMSDIFNGCSSLSSLPDISKWNTSNVINMRGMFWGLKNSVIIPKKFLDYKMDIF